MFQSMSASVDCACVATKEDVKKKKEVRKTSEGCETQTKCERHSKLHAHCPFANSSIRTVSVSIESLSEVSEPPRSIVNLRLCQHTVDEVS